MRLHYFRIFHHLQITPEMNKLGKFLPLSKSNRTNQLLLCFNKQSNYYCCHINTGTSKPAYNFQNAL